MSEVKLVAIINSFNRLTLLKPGLTALQQALKSCPFASAIVIFEAGSTDGSREWLEELQAGNPEPVLYVVTPGPGQDSSFSAGVNAACSYAASKFPQAESYLLYETDNWIGDSYPIVLGDNFLREHPKIAAVGFMARKHSGQPSGWGCSFPSAFEFLIGQQLSALGRLDRPVLVAGGVFDNRKWSTCDVVYTSPLLIRRQAWEESQGLDAVNFPFSDCDIDWSWRLMQSGWRIAVFDIDGVVHDNRQELSAWSGSRVIHFHRARLKLLNKHLGAWVNCLKPLLFLRHLLEACLLVPLVLVGKRPAESLQKRWKLMTSVFNDYL